MLKARKNRVQNSVSQLNPDEPYKENKEILIFAEKDLKSLRIPVVILSTQPSYDFGATRPALTPIPKLLLFNASMYDIFVFLLSLASNIFEQFQDW